MQPMQISTDVEAQSQQTIAKLTSRNFTLRIAGFAALTYLMIWIALRHRSHSNTAHDALPISFHCAPPTYFNSTTSDKLNEDILIEDYYTEKGAKLMTQENIQDFMSQFHNQPFDAWGYTYNQVKESLAPVKLKWFLDELKNRKGPQSIYESASGIGLNLYMTLEIIQENTDLSNIYIYSNEYLPKSVQRANNLFEYATPLSGKKGIICPGDSMNLSFVPAHSFDIVYTGYISPDWDPLKLNKSFRKNYDIMAGWCSDITANKTTATTEHSKTLARLMQQFQEKHYYRWVAEMVRIAKPGSPVIIESISYPYCQNTNDWGGVDKNFWKEKLIDSFGLPVQKDSVQYMDLSGLDMKRYHVFMRKLKL